MAEAIIFDIDGTLLDSVDLHARAWQEAFRHFGYDIPYSDVRFQIGKGGDQLIPVFLSKQEVEQKSKALTEFRAKLFKQEYLPAVKPFPGVRELFLKIRQSGQKIALASSARGDELHHYERLARIDDLLDTATSSADAEHSKPNPDIFEAALERLGVTQNREGVIVVGDSPHDVEAAKRAHLQTIGMRCGGFPEQALRDAGCIAIYDGPEDLLNHHAESPLANRPASAAAGS